MDLFLRCIKENIFCSHITFYDVLVFSADKFQENICRRSFNRSSDSFFLFFFFFLRCIDFDASLFLSLPLDAENFELKSILDPALTSQWFSDVMPAYITWINFKLLVLSQQPFLL